MADQRIIRVTEKGVLKVKPDMTRITMTLTGGFVKKAVNSRILGFTALVVFTFF